MRRRPSFRQTEKEGYFVQLPPRIVESIREQSRVEGRPQALIATEIFCRHYGIDPCSFGIQSVPAST